jgi:hypothetical protein
MATRSGEPGNSALTGIDAVSVDSVWAVGHSGQHTIIEYWNGQEWTVVPSPDGNGVGSWLRDVAVVSANDVWAVGAYVEDFGLPNKTLVEHWDGNTWSIVPSPNVGAWSDELEALTAVTANDIWAVGSGANDGETLIEHWNGTSWSIVTAPGSPGHRSFLQDIVALAANDIWAVGYVQLGSYSSQTLALHWDGTAWSVVPTPSPGSADNLLHSLAAVASNDIWAVGYYGNSSSTYLTMTMHWDGIKWSGVPSPNSDANINYLFGATALSTNDVWAVGAALDSPTQLLTMHWDGQAWNLITASLGYANAGLLDIEALSATDLMAVGTYTYGGGILGVRYSDPCPTPTATNTPIPPTPTRTPGLPTFTPQPPVESCSTNDLISSPNAAPNPNNLTGVEVISPNDVWAVGSFGGSETGVLIMHWDGAAWSLSPTPHFNAAVLRGITAVSATDVWAAGYTAGTALILHWDGTEWSRVPTPAASYLNDIDAISANDIWAVGGGSRTLTMHWDGTAWSTVGSPNRLLGWDGFEQNVLYQVEAISANDVWAVGFGGAVYHPDLRSDGTYGLHWDGTRWNEAIASPLTYGESRHLNAISAISANDIWAVGYAITSNLSRTDAIIMHWDGSSWTYVTNPGISTTLRDVQAISANSVYAIGSNGQPLTMHWDGAAWSVLSAPPGGTVTAIMGISESTLWAVGTNGADSYTLKWEGATWNQVDSSNRASGYNVLHAVKAIAPDDIWAVGFSAPYSSGYTAAQAKTLIQHWDGTQWSVVPSPAVMDDRGSHLWALSALAPNDVWAVGDHLFYQYPNGVIVSPLALHWDGNAWNVVPGLDDKYWGKSFAGVAAISANDVWAVGSTAPPYNVADSVAIMAHWDGQQWSRNSVGDPNRATHLTGVAALASDNVWAVGFTAPTYGSTYETFITHWDGKQWTRVSSPSLGTDNNHLRAVTAISPGDIWAVGYASMGGAGQALALHWDGTQWSIVPTPAVGESNYFIGMDAFSSSDVWAVGNYIVGGVPHTLAERWNGVRWELIPTPDRSSISNYLNGVGSVSRGESWAVGNYGYENARLTLVESMVAGFSDVQPDNTFYPYVQCLVGRDIISGYANCMFRPNNDVTRGQLSKIVSNSAGFSDDPGPQVFEDVPPDSTFYDWVNRLANRGHIGGYPCGGEGEPCGPDNLPYFRPNATATRGQISKIVSNAAGYDDIPPDQTFADVPPSNPFYLWIERLASRGIMSGYPCGGEGEPCGRDNKPYFRWGNNATRGQTSKIVANTFFPDCQAVATR